MATAKRKPSTPKSPEITAGWHGVPAVPLSDRLPSLDAFRGFVIAAMVFVNNLGDGVPKWMRHANDVGGPNVDWYTFVDLVFPGFLFMVGFSIPLSFFSKMSQGAGFPKLFWRLLVRAAMLVGIGLIMINAEHGGLNEEATGMSRDFWGALAYLCVVFLTLALPKTAAPWRVQLQKILKIVGGILLVYLLYKFRSNGEGGQLVWLQPSWWGIIGLIGWAYLGSGLIYLAFRGNSTALMGMVGVLAALDIGGRHNLLNWMGPLEDVFKDIFGTHALVVTAGMLLGSLFVGKEKISVLSRSLFIAIFGIGLYLAAVLTRPLFGYNKNAATVSWGLAAAGICCGLYLFFYLVVEVAQKRRWADWTLIPVGQNALLAYLFSEGNGMFCRAFLHHDMPWFGDYLTAVFQVFLVGAFAWACTKYKISLRL